MFIINLSDFPGRINLAIISPVMIATKMPIKYSDMITFRLSFGKKILANTANTASLALHDMKGVIIPVIKRSLWLVKVLVASMPGTLQPKLIMRGINALPGSCK